MTAPDAARAEAAPMKLYMIQFDGDEFYVEAPSFGAAIKAWNEYLTIEVPGWSAEEEPESVTLMHDQPVIR